MPQCKVYNLQSVTGRQIALQLYFVMKVQVKTIGQLALCKSSCYNDMSSAGLKVTCCLASTASAPFWSVASVAPEFEADPKHLWRGTSSRPSPGIGRADPNGPYAPQIRMILTLMTLSKRIQHSLPAISHHGIRLRL